jgi:hypothetical protein
MNRLVQQNAIFWPRDLVAFDEVDLMCC